MNKLVHWLRRKFRGRVIEKITTDTGHTIYKYRSGYVEHVDKDTGAKTDVLADLHERVHGLRTWKCSRMQGGGVVVFDNLNRDDAVARCARELGAVIYVDEPHGFIFYRDTTAIPVKS